jgi:hypothetical protein
VGSVSRSEVKEQEKFVLVARHTILIKRKLDLQQKTKIMKEINSSVSKQGIVSCDRIYTRSMTRWRIQE